MLANERRREVGILRAIGARRSHILRLFLGEVILIIAIGGLAGAAAGQSLIRYLSGSFTLLTRLGAVTTFSFGNLATALFAVAVGVLVCLIGAVLPVIRLARVEPPLAIKEQ